jgi:hypothetical protein
VGGLTTFVTDELERQCYRWTASGSEIRGVFVGRNVPVFTGGTADTWAEQDSLTPAAPFVAVPSTAYRTLLVVATPPRISCSNVGGVVNCVTTPGTTCGTGISPAPEPAASVSAPLSCA